MTRRPSGGLKERLPISYPFSLGAADTCRLGEEKMPWGQEAAVLAGVGLGGSTALMEADTVGLPEKSPADPVITQRETKAGKE